MSGSDESRRGESRRMDGLFVSPHGENFVSDVFVFLTVAGLVKCDAEQKLWHLLLQTASSCQISTRKYGVHNPVVASVHAL